jgi:arylsulfatase A-like enzyme
MKYCILSILAILFLTCSKQASSQQQSRPPTDGPPNIILIITDDMGIGSMGAYGNDQFHTPHLDYWANNGLKFEQFYVTSPVCSPSRASIFTGQPGSVNGITKVMKPGQSLRTQQLATGIPLFSEKIQQQSYRTALIGKWHLGYNAVNHPENRGFDVFTGFINGHIDYISHESSDGKWPLVNVSANGRRNSKKHLTQLLTDEALQFLQSDHTTPYCLVLSYANPHRPVILPDENAAFPGEADPKLDTPQRYKKLIELLDQEIGRIQQALVQSGDNTIVIFLSDHGAPAAFAGNGPYNGGKGTLYEGGIRVPALVYWPQKTDAKVIQDVVHSLDLYPTILHLAGVAVDSTTTSGRILIDHNGDYCTSSEKTYIWSFGKVKAIRQKKWKAIFIPIEQGESVKRYVSLPPESNLSKLARQFDNHVPLLFNLKLDPFERHNLSTSEQEVTHNLWTIIKTDSLGVKL